MLRISIPEPCHESWQDMRPTQRGAFCNACAKEVVDFTTMTDDEVKHYFINKKGQSTCGRFRTDQVRSISIEIPFSVLQKRIAGWKKFLAIVMISFGTMLFGCDVRTGKSVTGEPKSYPPPSPLIEADSLENSDGFLGVPYFIPDSTEATFQIQEECVTTTGIIFSEPVPIQGDVEISEIIVGGIKLDSTSRPNSILPAALKDSLATPLKDTMPSKQKIPTDSLNCGDPIIYSK